MPDYLGINQWYECIYNLSIGYISALIFFVLQVYIPTVRKQEEAKNILQPEIHNICTEMDTMLALFSCFVDVNQNEISIKHLQGDTIYYNKEAITGEKNVKSQAFDDFRKKFQSFPNTVQQKIDKLKSKSLYQDLDEDIIIIITTIEQCSFPTTVKSVGELYGICSSYSGLEKDLIEFKELHSQLVKYDEQPTFNVFTALSDEECAVYRQRLEQYGPLGEALNLQLARNIRK